VVEGEAVGGVGLGVGRHVFRSCGLPAHLHRTPPCL